jgi:curved DNA-binding protein CbpA
VIVAHGSISDRPLPRTFATVAAREFTGELVVDGGGREQRIAWRDGAIVGATAAHPADSAAKVAVTLGVLSSTQASEVARVIAANPGCDEVEVVARVARLSSEMVGRLGRRLAATRAARVFAVESGRFQLDDTPPLSAIPPVDARWVIYSGVRSHYTIDRLHRELTSMAQAILVPPDADLSAFGFGEGEADILTRLRGGRVNLMPAPADLDLRVLEAVALVLLATGVAEAVAGDPIITKRRPTTGSPIATPREGSGPIAPPRTATGPIAAPREASGPVVVPRGATGPVVVPRGATGPIAVPRATTTPIAVPREASGPSAVPREASGPSARTRATTTAPRHATAPIAVPPAPGPRPPSTPPPMARPPTTPPTGPRTITATGLGAPAATSAGRGRPRAADPARARELIADRKAAIDAGADHYTLLGLSPDASPEAVRTAYFELARYLHPDRLIAAGVTDDRREAHRVFARINEAFGVLSDPDRRAAYQQTLRAGGEAAVRAEQEAASEKVRQVLTGEECFRKGEMALRRMDLPEAVRQFRAAVELRPDEADHHAMLGWALYVAASDKAAELPAVRSHLRRATELTSTSAVPYLVLGRIARMEGDATAAVNHLRRALELSPRNSEAAAELRAAEALKAKPNSSSRPGLFSRPKK